MSSGASELINRVLGGLLYEDGKPKVLTGVIHELFLKALATGHPDAYLLKGIRLLEMGYADMAFNSLAEAEKRGCNHPLLNYYWGKYWLTESKTRPRDLDKASAYHTWAIGVGCSLGHVGLHSVLLNQLQTDIDNLPRNDRGYYRENVQLTPKILDDFAKAQRYLEDLELTGITCPAIFGQIGETYRKPADSQLKKPDLALKWHRHSAETYGSIQGFIGLYHHNWVMVKRNPNGYSDEKMADPERCSEALLHLFDALAYGFKDERIYELIITALSEASFKPTLAVFSSYLKLTKQTSHTDMKQEENNQSRKAQMILYFCHQLMDHEPALGYSHLGRIYWEGLGGVQRALKKATDVWVEGEKKGAVCYHLLVSGLASAYKIGWGVKQDGARLLECSEKGAPLAATKKDQDKAREYILHVYERGEAPVSRNSAMVREINRTQKYIG